jgi:hypothetical protein
LGPALRRSGRSLDSDLAFWLVSAKPQYSRDQRRDAGGPGQPRTCTAEQGIAKWRKSRRTANRPHQARCELDEIARELPCRVCGELDGVAVGCGLRSLVRLADRVDGRPVG